jgi:hypothetical protein
VSSLANLLVHSNPRCTFVGASAIISTSFHRTGRSHSMRVSSYSRYSHPTRKSILRTTSSTTLSSSMALSQDISSSRRERVETPPDFCHISLHECERGREPQLEHRHPADDVKARTVPALSPDAESSDSDMNGCSTDARLTITFAILRADKRCRELLGRECHAACLGDATAPTR